MTRPVVLTIAGSDPSGGAGIQADLRTFAALGVIGLSVVTALTVQNSQGVTAVHPVSEDILTAQMETLLSDTRPDAVKVGLLGSAGQVRAVAEAVRHYHLENVVLDPVLASSGGVPFLNKAGRNALARDLVPVCRLVTPNQDEWAQLGEISGVDVLVKGGHLIGPPVDTLRYATGQRQEFPGRRIPTPHTHGTGCFLSSAIAAGLAHGWPLETAIGQAKILLTSALSDPVTVGKGRGYPDALAAAGGCPFPGTLSHTEKTARLHGIYALTDPSLRPDRSAEEVTRAALAGGAQVIQLREKSADTQTWVETARRLKALTYAADALLIINDRVDVALAAESDGVHLGPDDLHPRDARRLLGPDRIIGVSVSSVDEAQDVAPYASYLGVGAIYGTATKHDAGPPVGTARIGEIHRAYPTLPLVAIGGIGAENIHEIAAAGADAAAVVAAIVGAEDMTAATRLLHQRFLAGVHSRPGRP